jgi:hypothetical protein
MCATRWMLEECAARIEHLRLEFGPLPAPGWHDIGVLLADDAALLARWLVIEGEQAGSADARTQAALLLGHVAFALTLPLACVLLRGGTSFPATLALRREPAVWEHGGRSGLTTNIRLRADPRATAMPLAQAADAAQHLGALLHPVIDALHRLSCLGHRALWLQATDSVVGAMLYAGRILGTQAFACDVARALLAAAGTPFAHGRTGLMHVAATAADGATLARWFTRRGGCCRWYTCPGGEYCATCVLRREPERVALLHAALLAEHAEAATQ